MFGSLLVMATDSDYLPISLLRMQTRFRGQEVCALMIMTPAPYAHPLTLLLSAAAAGRAAAPARVAARRQAEAPEGRAAAAREAAD
eukprot:708169-Rhodomonas_salina.1